MDRRAFLRMAAAGAATTIAGRSLAQHSGQPHASSMTVPAGKADYSLSIEPTTLEIAPGVHVKTVSYNGTVPGPLLRFKEGVPVTIDVVNKLPIEEIVHWHGFDIDPINDGAMEEGSPMIAANGGKIRYKFTPHLTGSRWYHTHASAEKDLSRSTYTGQFGFAYVEPKAGNPGHYDQEIFLPIHHWEPKIEMLGPPINGCEVTYKYATFDDKVFSSHAPIKVKKGQRVLFRFLNASATQNVSLALPGHQFEVIALDGNPVPVSAKVETIFLAVAERVDAIVEMSQPGIWMLASTDEKERKSGLGIKIEYAGSTGEAVWKDPSSVKWDYLQFAKPSTEDTKPEETFQMVFGKKAGGAADGMDLWMINGKSWPNIEPLKVQKDKHYRISMLNASPEFHPMHLHRHSFEVMSINGKKVSGLMKDTLDLSPFGRAEIDFIANNPGPALFHCHQQLHMDYGFMHMIQYV